MKTVLRDDGTGDITHIYYTTLNGEHIYLSKRDFDMVSQHGMTTQETVNTLAHRDGMTWFMELSNGMMSPEDFKYKVATINNLFKDEPIKIRTT